MLQFHPYNHLVNNESHHQVFSVCGPAHHPVLSLAAGRKLRHTFSLAHRQRLLKCAPEEHECVPSKLLWLPEFFDGINMDKDLAFCCRILFKKSFTEIWFPYYKIQPLKVHNLMIFGAYYINFLKIVVKYI